LLIKKKEKKEARNGCASKNTWVLDRSDYVPNNTLVLD